MARLSVISEGDVEVGDSWLSGSGHDDLVSQKGVTVGQVEHGLMGELLRVVRPSAPLKDNSIFRVNDMEVADPSIGNTIDMTLDEPC
jgi:hypothetical protein